MKRLILSMLAGATMMCVDAHDFTVQNADGKVIYYELLDDGTAAVTSKDNGTNSYAGIVRVPERVSYSGSLLEVTAVDAAAFYYCTALTEVYLPSTINSLGNNAFYGCSALTKANIPEGVTTVPYGAFYDCTSMVTVTLPSSVTEISNYAFYNCYGTKVIGENVKTIGSRAFAKPSDSKYVYQTLVFLGKTPPQVYTYTSGSSKYTDITQNWYSTNICIPKGTKTAYTNAYLGGFQAEFDYMRDNQAYTIVSSSARTCALSPVVYSSKSGNSIASVKPRVHPAEAVIPASIKDGSYTYTVVKVADGAYEQTGYNDEEITSMVLPRTITSIGNRAFYKLTSLKRLKIEANTPPAASSTSFTGITSTCTLVVPTGCKEAYAQKAYWQDFENIEESSEITINVGETFTDDGKNYEITSVNPAECALVKKGDYVYYTDEVFEVPEYAKLLGMNIAVTSIADNAMYSNKCQSIIVGANVRTIGNDAFSYGKAQTVSLPSSLTSIGEKAFYNSSLREITLPAGITELPNNLFYYCSNLQRVDMLGDITSIGNVAFYNCSKLQSISLPSSLTTIGNGAFNGCSSLGEVTIPESVTSIGDSSFAGCSSLTSVAIPAGVTELGTYVFNNCTALSEVSLPSTLLSIGNGAFAGCTFLSGISLPANLTTLGSSAFYQSGLVAIDIPWSVETLTNNPVSRCSKLERITGRYASTDGRCLIVDGTLRGFAPAGLSEYTVPEGASNVASGAFAGAEALTTVTIPASVMTVQNGAFNSCAGLKHLIINKSSSSLSLDQSFADSPLETLYIGRDLTWSDSWKGPFDNIKTLREIQYSDYVTTLRDYMFYQCNSVDEIILPSSITEIGYNTLCVISRVTCLALTPPSFTSSALSTTYPNVSLYVNEGSIESYQNADVWRTFASIKRIPQVGDEGYVFVYDGLRYEITNADEQTCKLIAPSTEVPYSGELALPVQATLSYNGLTQDFTVTALDKNALIDNDSVTAISLPSTIVTVAGIDHTTSALAEITVDEANPYFMAVDGVLYDKDITTLVVYPPARGGDYVVPSTISDLVGGFRERHAVESIEVPDGVSGWVNVSGCKSLRALTLGDGITSLSASNCPALESLQIGAGVDNIYGYTFSGTYNIKNLVIADSPNPLRVTRLSVDDGYVPAIDHNGMRRVYIGRNLEAQGSPRWCHFTSYSLRDVEFGPEFNNLDEYMLWSMYRVNGTVRVPSLEMWASVKKQGKSSYFPSFYNLMVGDVPVTGDLAVEGISEIKDYAFYRIVNDIDTITLGADVASIGAYAFALGWYDQAPEVSLIRCHAQTPPAANATSFSYIPDGCTLQVPIGSGRAYKADSVWGRFHIVELTSSGNQAGDVNSDGVVTVTDIVNVVNCILTDNSDAIDFEAADINCDGIITVTDVVGIVDIILNASAD